MAITFSDVSGNTGILQQTRKMMRVDANQWPTVNVVNSANLWSDFVTGYAIGADSRFAWDNTNHTKLPIGTTDLVLNQTDYSFLTDEQGNSIVTLLEVGLVDANGKETRLECIDRSDSNYLEEEFGTLTGTPTKYDKLTDNIIRLDTKPDASAVSDYDLKFYFQRVSPKFTVSSTTETTGFSPLLDRGFIIASAYDGAITLGLNNLQPLSVERQREEKRVVDYFTIRDNDEKKQMTMSPIQFR